MCMWLFNPPEPSCQPTDYLQIPYSGRCGSCRCVPPFWKVIGAPSDDYAALYFPALLGRNLTLFEQNLLEPCQWSKAVDLFPIAGQPFAGRVQLSFTSVEGSDADNPGWYLALDGLPPIGAVPRDTAWYHQRVFGKPDRRPFRCLSQNIFDLDPALGSGNFTGLPETITIQPFWP